MSATIILIITSSSTRNIDPPDVRAAPIHGILEIREIRIANIDIGRNLDLPGQGVGWNTNSKCIFRESGLLCHHIVRWPISQGGEFQVPVSFPPLGALVMDPDA